MRRVFQVVAAIMLMWFGVFLGLNDRRLGLMVTKIVSSRVRGQFVLGYAHYDYWTSLGSLILNTPVPVIGGDFEMRDPNGQLVMRVPRVEASINIGELVRGLLRSAVSAPFGRGVFIELHFSSGHVSNAFARIQPIQTKRVYPPGVSGPELGSEVNIVSTMSTRKPSPEDAPPSPGHVRITVDGSGVTFDQVTYEMAFPGWHARIEGLSGAATLRFSSDAAENKPGLLGFVYEVAPLSGRKGELVLGTPDAEGKGAFSFPLRDLELRRFGARASRRQDLVFRGTVVARDTPVELDGRLLDTYCDTGVSLDLSFERGGGLTELVPGELLMGQPRGRVRFYGPLSTTQPRTISNRRHPCLSETWHPQEFSSLPEERGVLISGQVADVDAQVATVAIHHAASRFVVDRGELHLPQVSGEALGGLVRAEPLHLSFHDDMAWQARISVSGGDPAQVGLMPKVLQPLVTGKLKGSFRVSGHLGPPSTHPERVLIDRVEAVVDRLGHRDPLPKELKIAGSFTVTPETVQWRNVRLAGETLLLDSERGSYSPRSGRVDSPLIELHGRGAPLGRVLQYFGVSGSAGETSATFRLGGRVLRPEVRDGELAVKDLELLGRKFVEVGSEFALKDGELAVSHLHSRGDTGKLSADGTIELYNGEVSNRPVDPKLTLRADVAELSLDSAAPGTRLSGILTGRAELAGTLKRPTGRLELAVPSLQVQDGRFTKVALQAELSPTGIVMRSLDALLGDGKLTSKAELRYDRGRPIDLQLDLQGLPLRELPGVQQLPFALDGRLGGKVRVLGVTQPLAPSLAGAVTVDDFTISGRPSAIIGPSLIPSTVTAPAEPEPLFGLLGMVVRSLSLRHGELAFTPVAGGTRVVGRLFDAFDVEGLVFLDAARPHGELAVRFGCQQSPVGAAPVGQAGHVGQTCDLAIAKLLPDMLQLGDVSLASSGELRIRFGEDARGLFEPAPRVLVGDGRGGPGPGCAMLAQRAQDPGAATPLSLTLHLSRAVLTVRTVSDDGEDQRYLAYNDGDVLLCSDGRELEVGQAHFHSQRLVGERANAQILLLPTDPHAPGPLLSDTHTSEHSGQVQVRGLLGAAGSDLHLLGQIRLELLEHLLRATFRHTHGEATVDVHVTGPAGAPVLRGTANLRAAHLVPYDIETPLDIETGQLELRPERATLHDLKLSVDGAQTIANGTMEVKRWLPLQLGQIDFQLRGEVSARLLQWQFARNLAEARGSLGLGAAGMRVTGTFQNPIVEGTLTAKDLFLNLRRFHELSFSRGTVRFVRTKGDDGRILIGRLPGESVGEPLSGLVDGDGKVTLNGSVDHSGLGGFMKADWYRALDNVRMTIKLDNVRHSSPGVYNCEATTTGAGLVLSGNRDEMHLSGDIEVVSGRYMQEFDFADRFLSARRVAEEEKPFWDGDPFLSALQLNLNMRTRGTFRVLNKLADLRLQTTGFTVNGPLVDIAMGGVIRVESGVFRPPGLRSEFAVKGDSKIEFTPSARWPDTPFVDVRGGTRDFDQNDQQRNIELALRGRVSELKVECLSSQGMSSADCASYLLLGDLSDSIRGRTAVTPPPLTSAAAGARAIEYGDPAAKLVTSQLLTNQVADPLRQKLRLDTVRIQFGVSTFDLQLCTHLGYYVRMCGLAEWGILGNSAAHYRGSAELQFSDLTVGSMSLERIERGFSFLEDTINRFKLQAGIRLPLRY